MTHTPRQYQHGCGVLLSARPACAGLPPATGGGRGAEGGGVVNGTKCKARATCFWSHLHTETPNVSRRGGRCMRRVELARCERSVNNMYPRNYNSKQHSWDAPVTAQRAVARGGRNAPSVSTLLAVSSPEFGLGCLTSPPLHSRMPPQALRSTRPEGPPPPPHPHHPHQHHQYSARASTPQAVHICEAAHTSPKHGPPAVTVQSFRLRQHLLNADGLAQGLLQDPQVPQLDALPHQSFRMQAHTQPPKAGRVGVTTS